MRKGGDPHMSFQLSRKVNVERAGEPGRTVISLRGAARRIARRARLFVAVAALIFAGAGLASAATNSQYGPTGLLQIPTADVASPGEMGIAAQSDGRSSVASLRYGAIDHVELGLANTLRGAGTEIVPHIKVQLAPEGSGNPGVAVGMEGSGFYVVASRQLPSPQFRAHVGVGTERFNGLFFGLSAALNPVQVEQGGFRLPSTLLIGEFDGRDLNLGARFSITRDLALDVGVRDFDDVILGLAYRTQL